MALIKDTHDTLSESTIDQFIATPVRQEAIALIDDRKIDKIEQHFKEIMLVLGLDLNDDSLKDTPRRVAKMYVKEAFSGLNTASKPEVTLFENKYQYKEMLIEKNITLYSYCEHHFVPIIGKVHVAYIPANNVIGLSKINRLVQYFAKRPQVQERLTNQIAEGLKEALRTEDVAVIVEATHLCVSSRGIQDTASSTTTACYLGAFEEEKNRDKFWQLMK